MTPEGLAGMKPAGTPAAPNFLKFGSGMTNQQKRAQIATFGSMGQDSRYTDPATTSYYKNLLLSDYGTPGFSLMPVERQFAQNVFGANPRADTPESIISAILRT